MLTWVILLVSAAGAVWIAADVIHVRRSLRARRRDELQKNIRRLELDLGFIEPEPNPFVMTDEPGQTIMVGNEAPVWGPSPMDMAVARYLREDDPPPAHASIPQWYDEYRAKMRNPRLYRDDSQDSLEVW